MSRIQLIALSLISLITAFVSNDAYAQNPFSSSPELPNAQKESTMLAKNVAANSQIQEILAVHNKYRAEVGVPPLQWSSTLAASAQQWANHLAQTGTFEHSHGKFGENLSEGTSGAFSLTQLVNEWINEKQYFRQGTFPNVSTTGNWGDVGHYTQVVWRNTKAVGCGLARGNGNDILVCQYSPAGNVIGQKVF